MNRLRNRNPKMVKIRGKGNISFKCKVCGKVWYKHPLSKRFSWQCPNGCKLEDLKDKEREHYREVIKSES